MHVAVRFSGFKEADAVIVGVADQPGELLLTEIALDFAAHGSGSEGKPSHFDVGFSRA